MATSQPGTVTYSDIQQDILEHDGRSIKTCWIAHVKEIHGLPLRKAPNRHSPKTRVHPCPEHIRPIIEASMRRLGLLAKSS